MGSQPELTSTKENSPVVDYNSSIPPTPQNEVSDEKSFNSSQNLNNYSLHFPQPSEVDVPLLKKFGPGLLIKVNSCTIPHPSVSRN